jgi:hypothetical protein
MEKQEWEIIGKYRGKKEVIDSANGKQDAEYLRSEYQMAFGNDWIITIKKKRS